MNRFLPKFISVLVVTPAVALVPVAHSTTVIATVNGMVCAFCAQGIDKKLRALDATQDVYVNLAKNVVAVQFKEGKQIADPQFRSLISEAGYEVKTTRFVEQSAAQIRVEMKSAKP
jgi:cation transport ATPase